MAFGWTSGLVGGGSEYVGSKRLSCKRSSYIKNVVLTLKVEVSSILFRPPSPVLLPSRLYFSQNSDSM